MTVTLDLESMAYPVEVLDGCDSGLLLFCSGRLGITDGHWFAQAGLTDVTAVDWDAATLEPFAEQYPGWWHYVKEDAFQYAWEARRNWDIVSVDAPSQYAPQLVEHIPLWLALATKRATLTLYRHCFVGVPTVDELPDPPDGWRYDRLIRRSEFRGGIYWLVCERA